MAIVPQSVRMALLAWRQHGIPSDIQKKEKTMTPRTLRSIFAAAVVGLWTAALNPACAAQTEKERAELATALKAAKATLEDGLKVSEREGKPISAKFEIEDGKPQLSIYTLKDNDFTEVIADPQTGAIAKAEKITDKEDREAAAQQKDAMAKAKVTLLSATEKAVQANAGFRAVSIFPTMEGGHPTAAVTLLQNATYKTVAEKLD
jgi:hypothetical protein